MNDGAGPPVVALTLDDALRGRVRVGTLAAAPVQVAATEGDLAREIAETCGELSELYAGRTPAAIDELRPARELYRAFGIDPTKTRPSSEKLLRRVLQEKPLPRISNAVDLGNLLALQFLLPIGLYDAATIASEVTLRAGAPGESYEGIAGQDVHLGGRPLLADHRGPFGNPTADSRRSAVTESTTSLWLIVFAPASYPVSRLEEQMQASARSFARFLRGSVAVATAGAIVE